MKRSVWIYCILIATLGCTGCAAALTQLGPPKPRIIDGEITAGEFNRYEHSFFTRQNIVYLEKRPMCFEMRQKIRRMQKVPRGLLLTIPEMAFYGLGLTDAVITFAIVDASKRDTPLAEFPTNSNVECGEKRAASNEPLIIYNQEADLERATVTDENGEIDLKEVFPELTGVVQLVIKHETDAAPVLFYEYDADS
jgi:hypothetical protein